MAKTTRIRDKTVTYEENAEEGIKYLRDDLQDEEAAVLFEHAERAGEAQFEDDEDRQFTLLYHKNAYTLVRRDK